MGNFSNFSHNLNTSVTQQIPLDSLLLLNIKLLGSTTFIICVICAFKMLRNIFSYCYNLMEEEVELNKSD